MTDDSQNLRDPVELLAEEFMERKRRGENPTLAEYIEKHPQLADDIRDLFPALVVLEDFKPATDSSATSATQSAARRDEPKLYELGDYRILREIGRGGMGIVYEAEQVSLGRRVALKVLPRQTILDAKQRHRFEREARAAARLHHTNIVPIFGVGEQDGLSYYVMQYIQGLGLDEVLEELKRMRAGETEERDPRKAGSLRVSRKDVSATEVAHSLVTGRFQREEESDHKGNGASAGRAPLGSTVEVAPEAIAAMRVKAHTDPTEAAVVPPSQSNTPDRSTDSGRLSDTFSLSASSVSLPGGSEVRSRGRARNNYWHSIANIGVQVAGAIGYAHDQGVLHRDIKPSNLLLDTRGTVWVTDFGLAKADDQQNLTHTGDILGTLRYMPPEAFEAKTDPRSDIYSLGLTLYELAALRPAFSETERNRLVKQVTTGEPPNLARLASHAPRDLVTIIHKAIEREPQRRYQTAAELSADLIRFIDDEPIHARRVSAVERAVRWARHNRAVAGLMTTVALLLVVAAVGSTIAAAYLNRLAGDRQTALDEVVSERDAKQSALTEVERSRETAQRLAESNRKGLVRFNASRGADLAEQADPFAALPWFAEALALDVNHPAEERLHRMRLATTLRSAPKLKHSWLTRPGAGCIQFSPDGKRIAATGTKLATWFHGEVPWRSAPVHVWDANTGAATPPLAHDRPVMSMALQPGGDLIATSGLDGIVRIWNAATGKIERELVHQSHSVLLAAFSPDGKRLLTGGSMATTSNAATHLYVWDVQTGTRLADLVHRAAVVAAAFSPDARRVVVGAESSVWIWDLETKATVVEPLRATSRVIEVAFTEGAQRIVALGLDGSLRVWDAHSGEATSEPSSSDAVFRALSPDRRRAASFNRQGAAIQIWDLASRQPLTKPLQHDLEVTEVQFSPDGHLVVSAARDRTARVWLADTGRLLAVLRHPSGVMSAAFNNDARLVATLDAEGSVRLWDLAGMQPDAPSARHDAFIHHAVFSPDGRFLATASADRTARIWDAETGAAIGAPLRHSGSVLCVAFSPDSKRIAAGSEDGVVALWDVATGKPASRTPRHWRSINYLDFSPDGKLLVSASQMTARIFNTETVKPVGEPLRHGYKINQARFSPDGRWIVTASADRKARVWSATTGKPRTDEIWHAGPVTVAMFTSDGGRILTASAAGPLAAQHARLWDAASGRPVGPPLMHADGILDAACGTSGNTRDLVVTASADSTARVWDALTGKAITPPLKHENHVVSVALGAGDRLVATASRDGKVRVFDVHTGIAVTPPLEHGNLLTAVALHPTRDLLAATTVDGQIRFWDLRPDQRSVSDWRKMAQVLSGQRIEASGATLPVPAAEVQGFWQELPESFRREAATTERQQTAWRDSLAADVRRIERRQQAHAAAAEATQHTSEARWTDSVASFRRAVELARTDYDFPLLFSIARSLGLSFEIGDDPQRLVENLANDQPQNVFLWLDRDQVQQNPQRAGLGPVRDIVLGVEVSEDAGGARVTAFRNIGGAEQAGLQIGDLLTHVDGVSVASRSQVLQILRNRQPGQVVVVRARQGALAFDARVPVVAELIDVSPMLRDRNLIAQEANDWRRAGGRPLHVAAAPGRKATIGWVRDYKPFRHVAGATRRQFEEASESLSPGFMPTWLHVAGDLWSAVWLQEGPTHVWRQSENLDEQALRQAIVSHQSNGFRPIIVCPHRTGDGQTRYIAVWLRDATPNRVLIRLAETEFNAELAKLPKGWRPERIWAHREGNDRFFTAVIIEDTQITRWEVDTAVPSWAVDEHLNRYARENYLALGWTIDVRESSEVGLDSSIEIANTKARRGRALVSQGQLDQGLALLSDAHQSMPGNYPIAMDLADACIVAGRWSQASSALEAHFAKRAAPTDDENETEEAPIRNPSPTVTLATFGWWVSGPHEPHDGDPIVRGQLHETPSDAPRPPEPSSWRRLVHYATQELNLDQHFRDQPGTYYALSYVYSPAARDTVVHLPRDKSASAWLNDKLVYERIATDEVKLAPPIAVQLRAGWNSLLLRLQVPRGHELVARWMRTPRAVADAYEEVGRNDLAYDAWTKAVSASPQDRELLRSRASSAVQLGRFADAVADLEVATKFRPDESSLRFLLGLVRAQWSQVKAISPEQSKELADAAVREIASAVRSGYSALGNPDLTTNPVIAPLMDRPDMQAVVLSSLQYGDSLSETIYHRRDERFGGYWVSSFPLQEFLDAQDEQLKKDHRLIFATSTDWHGMPTFTASWAKDGKRTQTRLHVDRSAIEQAHRTLAAEYQLASLDAYSWHGEQRWIGVWTHEGPSFSQELHFDLDRAALADHLGKQANRGFRPSLVTSYLDDAGRLLFVAATINDGAKTQTHLHLTIDELRKKLDSLEAGWRPLLVDSYLENHRRFSSAVFINDGGAVEWKIALAKPDSEILKQLEQIKQDEFWPVHQTVTPDPGDPQPVLRRAAFLTRFQRAAEAEQELSQAIPRFPQRSELLAARAELRAKANQFREAADDYGAAIRVKPDDADLKLARGRALAGRSAQTLIAGNSDWKWLFPLDGVDPVEKTPDFHTEFFNLDFDDSSWKTGRDSLHRNEGFGYGEYVSVDLGTPPSGRRFTAYFRHRFKTTAPMVNLQLRYARDDGTIVYLDGVEVLRDNMPSSPERFHLRSSRTVRGLDPKRLRYAHRLSVELPPGEHVLAISLHNSDPISSDLRLAGVTLTADEKGTSLQELASADEFADRASFFESQNQFDAAEQDLSSAVALSPGDAKTIAARARLHLRREQWTKAVADFDAAMRLQPNDAEFHAECALALARLNEREKALADLAAAAKLRPADDAFRRRQGQLYAILDSAIIVPPGSTWKWLHPSDGVDPAESEPDFHQSFFRPDYNDTDWQEGKDGDGELVGFGYGQSVAVPFSRPPSGKRYTAYFRHKFRTEKRHEALNLTLRVDDGAIVYLDGVEVARGGMGQQPHEHKLLARDANSFGSSVTIPIAAPLPPGEHVLAVSVHNANPESSDLVFGAVALHGAPKESTDTALDDPEALRGRAEAYVQLGQVERAIADLKKVIELAPDDMQAYVTLADLLYTNQRYAEAAEGYSRVIARFEPRNAHRFELRATCYENLRQWENARNDWTTVISLTSSRNWRATRYAERARTWIGELNWQKAAEDHARALDEAYWVPDTFDLSVGAGVFVIAGRMQDAVRVAESMIERRGAGVGASYYCRMLATVPLTQQQHAEALEAIEQGLLPESQSLIAANQYRAGQYRRALETMDRSTTFLHEHRFVRALAHFQLGEIPEAGRFLAEGNEHLEAELARLSRGSRGVYLFDIVRIIAWQREATATIVPRLIAELSKSLQSDPENADLLFERSRLQSQLGAVDEALAGLGQAIALKPDESRFRLLRGKLLANARRWDEAADDFVRVVPHLPAGGQLWYGSLPEAANLIGGTDELFSRLTTRASGEKGAGHRTLWVARAQSLAAKGAWPDVIHVLDHITATWPDDNDAWYRKATLQMMLGQREEYAAACRELLVLYRDTQDAVWAERTAKVCLLAPGTDGDRATAIELARRATDRPGSSPELLKWFYLARALAEHRAGEFDEALIWVERSLARSPLPVCDGMCHVIAALVEKARGNTAAAKIALAKADELARLHFPQPNAGGLDGGWHNWANFKVLRAEAAAQVERAGR